MPTALIRSYAFTDHRKGWSGDITHEPFGVGLC